MKITQLLLTCAIGLGAALGSISPVTAQIDPKKLPAAKEAVATFAARAKGSEKSGEVPRVSDPAIKQLLDIAYDLRDIEAAKVPFALLTPLSERMLLGTQVGVIYMLAGTGSTDIGQIASDPAAGDKINLNVVKYPDELGRYFDFAVTIQAAIAQTVQTYISTAKPAELARPNFQSGLADVRGGAARTISGTIETLAVNGLSNEWIRARLVTLAAAAPKFRALLLADQKEELRKLAIACADVTDDAQAKKALQDFAQTMAGG
jgi:hypothetical protein